MVARACAPNNGAGVAIRRRGRHSWHSIRANHWSCFVSEKLGIGAAFPKLTLNLVGGGTLDLPEGLDAKYSVILFYRGHW
jgi:hypothetical protein